MYRAWCGEARAWRAWSASSGSRLRLARLGQGLSDAVRLILAHADEHASVDNLHRESLQGNDGGDPHCRAGAYVEAALVERAFHDAVDHHAIRQVGVLVRAYVLRGVELAFGLVDRHGEPADPDLLDVFVLEVGGVAGRMPVRAKRRCLRRCAHDCRHRNNVRIRTPSAASLNLGGRSSWYRRSRSGV